ncbi:MAG TPA: hypothetical protein VGF85_00670 [Opitutaceae bacterium]|jgi:hypothetical protein
MRTENEAWARLRHYAAAQITPGFPERVLRAARAGTSPLMVSHFLMCAATAAMCLVAVALYDARVSSDDNAQSVTGWGEVAAQASDLEQGL